MDYDIRSSVPLFVLQTMSLLFLRLQGEYWLACNYDCHFSSSFKYLASHTHFPCQWYFCGTFVFAECWHPPVPDWCVHSSALSFFCSMSKGPLWPLLCQQHFQCDSILEGHEGSGSQLLMDCCKHFLRTVTWIYWILSIFLCSIKGVRCTNSHKSTGWKLSGCVSTEKQKWERFGKLF